MLASEKQARLRLIDDLIDSLRNDPDPRAPAAIERLLRQRENLVNPPAQVVRLKTVKLEVRR